MISMKKVVTAGMLAVALTATTGAVASAAPAGSRVNTCNGANWCSSGVGTAGGGTVWVDFSVSNGSGQATISGIVCPAVGSICGTCQTYKEYVPYHGTYDCGALVHPGDTVSTSVHFYDGSHADITVGWHQ
ncbi:hypothetical protein [Kutzneria chonburiensis]|uniref:Secreted protein n=1 Tax=Kutzneria chonburiensis TaxID=1483604 RepID=A0ABV6MMW1_9PSEU|nr:hypothetical protein [Kutzneria chonburiensis]